MKHLYKFIALVFIFMIGIAFFSKSIPSISVSTTTASSIQDSTFPMVYLQVGESFINPLHGYSSELNSSTVRESITPLDTGKTFAVNIAENDSKIKKLSYELRDIANNKSIETGDITAFDKNKKYKVATVHLKEAMDTSTEYGFCMTLITNYSKKIHFYTRIKYYDNDFFLFKKLDFVAKFHAATFDQGKSLDLSQYLESGTNDDSSYESVDIHSSRKLITWGKLKPKKLTDVVPTVKELNIETAAISQTYFVSATTASGSETYQVKEFYRVRYSGGRIYLLYFKRTMEAIFDPSLISINKSEVKIGISSAEDLDITSSDSNKKFAFVRNGSLWYYDLKKNELNNVFSFETGNNDYIREYYDQHNIRILNLDDDGNISFVVYGYMNCGDYEGRVGILLYDYSVADNQITERVYLPLTTTYEQLKEDFDDFCYINNKNIFYFSLQDTVYAYNISSKRYDILTQNASADNFLMLEQAHCFIWSNASANGNASKLTILDLNSSKELTLKAPSGQSLVALGTIDSNVVYGFVRNKDIHESTTGDIIRPAYKLVISDCTGNILREYNTRNTYVTNAVVDGNVIRLKRLKRVSGAWKKASDDSIMNQKNTAAQAIKLTTRITDKALTEKYIYAYGGITGSYADASKAITLADEQMGVVMDSDSHIIWERGGKFLSKEIAGITYPSGNISTIKASTQMLLQAAQVTTTVSELKGSTIMKMLRSHLDTPVNLTGCTVDEILYFVSSEKPVIAMKSSGHAVLIIGYDSSSVTWMDPATHRKRKVSLNQAEHMFKQAGYVFVSYVD